MMRAAKIGVLVLLTAVTVGIAIWRIRSLPEPPAASSPTAAAKQPKLRAALPGTQENFEKALTGMKETNELIINWSILLLGGTMALAIAARGARLKDQNWGLIWMTPIWVFLGASLLLASEFQRALTYQIAVGAYDFPVLNDALFLQVELFTYSLIPLTILALWYLVARLLLFEESPSGKGDNAN